MSIRIPKRDAQTLLAWLMSYLEDARMLRSRIVKTGDLTMSSLLEQRITTLEGLTDILFKALGKDVNP